MAKPSDRRPSSILACFTQPTCWLVYALLQCAAADGLTVSRYELPTGEFMKFVIKWLSIFTAIAMAVSVLAFSPLNAQTNGLPLCAGLTATIVGTNGDDVIEGTFEDDVIVGLGGNDVINGASGSDTICGGDGDDIINGQSQADTIFGEAGNDTITGAAGADILDGGLGNDTITGDSQNDIIHGGDGDDDLNGSSGDDTIDGGNGIDVVDGSFNDDTCDDAETAISCETETSNGESDGGPVDPGPGPEAPPLCAGLTPSIVGTSGDDVIEGTFEDDVIVGLGGNDVINGASGSDTICGGDGNDIINGQSQADTIFGEAGNDTITGAAGADILDGGPGNDIINGNSQKDVLSGGDGDDTIDGGAGADVIDGGDGNDDLQGWNGADEVFGGAGNDSIDGWNGTDELYGESGDDVITGHNGNDELFGDAGQDVLDGGNGRDVCVDGEELVSCDLLGTTDTDLDGVVDFIEERVGTSLNSIDTDNDGLSDGFEIFHGGSDHLPLEGDSDGDGRGDGAEDADEDGLPALDEQALGTDPLEADTDGDRANDGDEVDSGTDPLVPDQPIQDTVVSDGRVEVVLSGAGDLSGTLTIEVNNNAFLNNSPGAVGDVYDIELDAFGEDNLESATVTLGYDAIPGDAADLRVFTWDEELLIWVQAGSQDHVLNPGEQTVTASVDHFSTFQLFDLREWLNFWRTQTDCSAGIDPGDGTPATGAVDISLVIDSSGSMQQNDPDGLRLDAANEFIGLLRTDNEDPELNDRAAVVDFDSQARLEESLTSDADELRREVNQIDSSGGTNLSNGVRVALTHHLVFGRATSSQIIILLTDGQGSYDRNLTTSAADNDVAIFTIGLGAGVDDALLQGIADGTGGRYFPVQEASGLSDVFVEIGGDVVTADQDMDGIADCDELDGILSGSGQEFFSDPTLLDSDDDLLNDGIEVGEKRSSPVYTLDANPEAFDFYPVISDPDDANSDFDTTPDNSATIPALADDSYEFGEGADPFSIDSDNESNGPGNSVLDDPLELLIGTDPNNRDTDGDGFSDFEEFFLFESEDPFTDFDPLVPDRIISASEFALLYQQGFWCGDAGNACLISEEDRATLPYLVGSIASGFGGPLADSRDVAGLVSQGDIVGAVVGGIGFLPIGGDTASGVNKITRELSDLPDELTVDILNRLDDLPIPDSAADDILEGVVGDARRAFRAVGGSDEGFQRLIDSRVNVNAIAAALQNPLSRTARFNAPEQFLSDWRVGERVLRDSEPGFIARGKGFANPANPGSRKDYRIVDAWDPDRLVALESKVGTQRLTESIQQQITRDAALRDNGDFDRLNGVEWHFFPSDATGKIADDPDLFEALQKANIPYVIHLP